MQTKGKDGRFIRTRAVWMPELWDEGYRDNRGRFRVYRPDYPRAYGGGYALRAHIVWWLKTGKIHPKGTNLHHKNKVVDDDRFENLELIDHGEHARLHRTKPPRLFKCEHCGIVFELLPKRGKIVRRFCSQRCYHAHPRSKKTTKKKCRECGQIYELPTYRAKRTRFCSQRCAATHNWRIRKSAY